MVLAWCKIDETRDGKKLLDVTSLVCGQEMLMLFESKFETYKFTHSALSKDKKRFRKTLKYGIDVHLCHDCHVNIGAKIVALPLIGEVALIEWDYAVQKLLALGADVNVVISDTFTSEPLFFYLMRAMPSTKSALNIISMIIEKANFSLIERNQHMVLDVMFEKKYPAEIVKTLMKRGLKLFDRDKDNFSLRDRIYIQTYKSNRVLMQKNLAFIDQVVIDLVFDNARDLMEDMVLNSYDFSTVVDQDGQSLENIITSEGNMEMLDFMNSMQAYQVMW